MRCGIIGDTHAPATRIGYMRFCQDTFDAWDCDTIIHIGDWVDWHSISSHVKEPQNPGPKDEYELAKEKVAQWVEAFKHYKNKKVCIGNHDERPARLAKSVSIPEFMIKPYSELWNAPDWEWDFNFTIDDVLYKHGTGRSGIHPAWTLMNRIHMSVVIGHCHSRSGIKWGCNKLRRFFGVDTGCGIDEKAWQFAYGKEMPERPFLSCAVVIDGVPYIEPMKCGINELYHDSNFKEK